MKMGKCNSQNTIKVTFESTLRINCAAITVTPYEIAPLGGGKTRVSSEVPLFAIIVHFIATNSCFKEIIYL